VCDDATDADREHVGSFMVPDIEVAIADAGLGQVDDDHPIQVRFDCFGHDNRRGLAQNREVFRSSFSTSVVGDSTPEAIGSNLPANGPARSAAGRDTGVFCV
jgi:hypothetical protein